MNRKLTIICIGVLLLAMSALATPIFAQDAGPAGGRQIGEDGNIMLHVNAGAKSQGEGTGPLIPECIIWDIGDDVGDSQRPTITYNSDQGDLP